MLVFNYHPYKIRGAFYYCGWLAVSWLCLVLLLTQSWEHTLKNPAAIIFIYRAFFHPMLGYLSAWAGLTVGFSAPVALAAMAFTKYLSPFGLQNNVWLRYCNYYFSWIDAQLYNQAQQQVSEWINDY